MEWNKISSQRLPMWKYVYLIALPASFSKGVRLQKDKVSTDYRRFDINVAKLNRFNWTEEKDIFITPPSKIEMKVLPVDLLIQRYTAKYV